MRRDPVPGMRATEREWKRVILAVLDDRSVRAVASDCCMGIVTAQAMVSLIRKTMAADLPTGLHGIVEADETYMGPKWHNRKRSDLGKTRRGRGTDNVPVFGVIEPKRKLVYAVVVPSIKGKDLLPIIKERVRKKTMVYTDTSTSYRRLRHLGYEHETVDHSNGEYVRGEVTTNHIESFWGWLKRRHKVCGGIRNDRLHLFVGSWTWIFNHRHESLRDRVNYIMKLLQKQN